MEGLSDEGDEEDRQQLRGRNECEELLSDYSSSRKKRKKRHRHKHKRYSSTGDVEEAGDSNRAASQQCCSSSVSSVSSYASSYYCSNGSCSSSLASLSHCPVHNGSVNAAGGGPVMPVPTTPSSSSTSSMSMTTQPQTPPFRIKLKFGNNESHTINIPVVDDHIQVSPRTGSGSGLVNFHFNHRRRRRDSSSGSGEPLAQVLVGATTQPAIATVSSATSKLKSPASPPLLVN